MGVGYDSICGIGFKVTVTDEMKEPYLDEGEWFDFYKFFGNIVKGTNFTYGYYGNSLCGEEFEYAIFIPNTTPVYDIERRIFELQKFLVENGFEVPLFTGKVTLNDVLIEELLIM